MNAETIGLWAGAIWTALSEAEGKLELKAIKKATKLKDKEAFAAIGWLAREGKINVVASEDGKTVDVNLL